MLDLLINLVFKFYVQTPFRAKIVDSNFTFEVESKDSSTMGNEGSKDKRSYRKQNASVYQEVIDHYEKSRKISTKKCATNPKIKDSNIDVVVRLRPLFVHEVKKGEFPVIRCVYSSSTPKLPKQNFILVHKCLPAPDMKQENAFVEHYGFSLPNGHIFCDDHSTEDVYKSSVKPIIDFISDTRATAEQRGTIFMYGQTGTGKTYTINGIVQLLANDLINRLLDLENSHRWKLNVQCLEMMGDSLYDLNNRHKEVRLLQGSGNARDIHVVGATKVEVSSPSEIWQAYDNAAQLRETHATVVNSQSSRSHYVFRIIIEYDDTSFARLTLVDLAGSERNADSFYHDSDRQRESAWINSSLSALKDVIRNVSKGSSHVPYRASKLTQLLRDSFEGQGCKTLVISTLSPIATDTEHTMNTLQVMSLLANNSDVQPTSEKTIVRDVVTPSAPDRLKPVNKWTAEECLTWVSNAEKGRFNKFCSCFPSSLNGAQLTRFTSQRFAQITGDQDTGEAMRKALDHYNEVLNRQKTSLAEEQRKRHK
jgi:kinesin family protein 2/24